MLSLSPHDVHDSVHAWPKRRITSCKRARRMQQIANVCPCAADLLQQKREVSARSIRADVGTNRDQQRDRQQRVHQQHEHLCGRLSTASQQRHQHLISRQQSSTQQREHQQRENQQRKDQQRECQPSSIIAAHLCHSKRHQH